MNIPTIKKFKEEFDQWIFGSKALYRKVSQPNWLPVTMNTWDITVNLIDAIIMDDIYIEFRKALAEGETVQVYTIIEKAPIGFHDVYGWKDIKTIKYSPSVLDYRIKPKGA